MDDNYPFVTVHTKILQMIFISEAFYITHNQNQYNTMQTQSVDKKAGVGVDFGYA